MWHTLPSKGVIMNFSEKYYEYIEKYKHAHTEGIYTRGSRNPDDKTPLRAVAPNVTMVGFGPERWSGLSLIHI